MQFQFSCSCGQPINATERHVGLKFRCPDCGVELAVPAPDKTDLDLFLDDCLTNRHHGPSKWTSVGPQSEDNSTVFLDKDTDDLKPLAQVSSHPSLPDGRSNASNTQIGILHGWRAKITLSILAIAACWLFLAPTRCEVWWSKSGDVKRGAGISVYIARNTANLRTAITNAMLEAGGMEGAFADQERWKEAMARMITPDGLRKVQAMAQEVRTNADGTAWVWLVPGEYVVWTTSIDEGFWVTRYDSLSLTRALSLGSFERVEGDLILADFRAVTPMRCLRELNRVASH